MVSDRENATRCSRTLGSKRPTNPGTTKARRRAALAVAFVDSLGVVAERSIAAGFKPASPEKASSVRIRSTPPQSPGFGWGSSFSRDLIVWIRRYALPSDPVFDLGWTTSRHFLLLSDQKVAGYNGPSWPSRRTLRSPSLWTTRSSGLEKTTKPLKDSWRTFS